MKISVGGKWEIDITESTISEKLEEEIKKTLRLTNEIDKKVEDIAYGDDARTSDGSTRKGQRGAG